MSYRFAPVEVLEKLAVPSAELGSVLARLHALLSVGEVAVLSTCNRVEVYAAVTGPVDPVTREVAALVAARGHVPVGDVLRMARIHVGGAAAEHLFSVACGLDSMAVGEDQIVTQIKAAARAAVAAGTTGPAVTSLIDAALRVSKRARTQTTISTEGISLARAGLDLARAHLGGLAGHDAVVLGTGPTGRLAARLRAWQLGCGPGHCRCLRAGARHHEPSRQQESCRRDFAVPGHSLACRASAGKVMWDLRPSS